LGCLPGQCCCCTGRRLALTKRECMYAFMPGSIRGNPCRPTVSFITLTSVTWCVTQKLKAREAAAALEGDAEELEAGEAEDAEGDAADSEPAGEREAGADDVYQGEKEHEVDDELAAEYGSADEYDDADAYATDSDLDAGGGRVGAYDEDAYGDEGDGMQSGDAPSGRAEAFLEKYGTDLYSADEPEGDVDDVGSVRPDAGEALPRRPSAGAAKAGRRPAR